MKTIRNLWITNWKAKVIVGLVLILAAGVMCWDLLLPATIARILVDQNGLGRVSNVTPVDDGCVKNTINNDNSVESWDVEQGKTYKVTLTKVTDCANGGNDPSIEVIVKNDAVGNYCTTATRTANVGEYTFNITMPLTSCNTFPIVYCTQGCAENTGFTARRSDGIDKQSHLRAATFGTGCSNPVADTDCNLPCTPPKINCPTDINVCTDDGKCSAVVTYDPTTTDGCGKVTLVCNPPSGSTFTVGMTSVTCTATDEKYNTASCSFNVTVKDCEKPVIECPTVEPVCNEPGQCSANVDFKVTARDNCDSNVKVDCDHQPGLFPVGTTTVNCTAKDTAGNTAYCTFDVTVKDCEKPVIACPNDIEKCNDLEKCGASVSFEVTAKDNCSDVKVSCDYTSGSTFPVGVTKVTCTAKDTAGNTADCSFNVTVKDCEKPVIKCPYDIEVYNDPGSCSAKVNFDVPATDNCDGGVPVNCDYASGSTFPVGVTKVTCTAKDTAGNTADCSFNVKVKDSTKGSISGKKFYDANANGKDDDGQVVIGWKVVLSGAASATTYTDNNGNYSFPDLPPGMYTVTELAPNSSWVTVTEKSCTFTIKCDNASNNFYCNFGNYCTTPSGGKTIGFWRNTNGQALILDADLAALSALNLVDASGNAFNPTTKTQLATWLQNANATNMAYMLSAQLAAMKLNLLHGFVIGSALDPCSGETVNNLASDADAALGADGSTPAGDPNRAPQEALKNCLDALNNNGPVVSSQPCPFAPKY